jgi:dUTP pyrophosphatase
MSQALLVKRQHADAVIPKYQTAGSSGFDLHSVEEVDIPAGNVALVKTGLSFGIPSGYEIQVRSRSGLALKNGVFVLNSPGTVDDDYTGEIGVILANFGKVPYHVTKGARIAQAVLMKVEKASLEQVTLLEETDRGSGGFGSTGV